MVNEYTALDIEICNWMYWSVDHVAFGLHLDSIAVSMSSIVLFISLTVCIYSYEYLYEDCHRVRFIFLLSLFTLFMLILVSSSLLLMLFIGWEGVGILSYLLINFWFTRESANTSSLKALIMNKVGDVGLLLAISSVYLYSSLLSYPSFSCPHTDLLCAMVSAGIILLIRSSYLFNGSPVYLAVLALLGGFTAWVGAISSIDQSDIKNVITCINHGSRTKCQQMV